MVSPIGRETWPQSWWGPKPKKHHKAVDYVFDIDEEGFSSSIEVHFDFGSFGCGETYGLESFNPVVDRQTKFKPGLVKRAREVNRASVYFMQHWLCPDGILLQAEASNCSAVRDHVDAGIAWKPSETCTRLVEGIFTHTHTRRCP